MDAGYFKGTSADQDNRFIDKNKKLMKTMKFAEGIDKKIDMTKVDMEIIRPWINSTITSYLGYEDDVVVEFSCSQLEQSVDSKQMQVNLTGFLGAKNAREFMEKLWSLLLSAMEDIYGIPEELKEQKKEQLRLKQAEQERLSEAQKNQQLMIQEAIAKIKNSAALKFGRSPSPKPKKLGTVGSNPHSSRSVSRSASRNSEPIKQESVDVKDSSENRTKHDKMAEAKSDENSKRDGSKWKFRQRSYGRNRKRSHSPPNYRRKSVEHSPDSDDRAERSVSPQQRNDLNEDRVVMSPQRRRSHDYERHKGQGWRNSGRNSWNSKSNVRRRKAHERSLSRTPSDENMRERRSVEKSSFNQDRKYQSRYNRPSSQEIGISHAVHSRGVRKDDPLSPQIVTAASDFSPHVRSTRRFASSGGRHAGRSHQSGLYPDDEDQMRLSQSLRTDLTFPRAERLVASNERTSHNSRRHERGSYLDADPETLYDYDPMSRRDLSLIDTRNRKDFSGRTDNREIYESSRTRQKARYNEAYRNETEYWRNSPPPGDEFVTSEVRRRYEKAMEELYGSDKRVHKASNQRYDLYDRRHCQLPYEHVASYDNGNKASLSDRRVQHSSSMKRSERSPVTSRSSRTFVRSVYDERAADCARSNYEPQTDRNHRRDVFHSEGIRHHDDYRSRAVHRHDEMDRYVSHRTARCSNKDAGYRDGHWSHRNVHADDFDEGRNRPVRHSDGEHLQKYVHNKPHPRSSSCRTSGSPRVSVQDEWISEDEAKVLPSASRRNREDVAMPYSRTDRRRSETRTGQNFEHQLKYYSRTRLEEDGAKQNRSVSRDRSISRASHDVDSPSSDRFGRDGVSRWQSVGMKRSRDERDDLYEDAEKKSFSSRTSSSPLSKKPRTEECSGDEDNEAVKVCKTEESEEKSTKKKKKKKEKKKKRKKNKKHKKHKHRKSEDENSEHETHDDEVNTPTPNSE